MTDAPPGQGDRPSPPGQDASGGVDRTPVIVALGVLLMAIVVGLIAARLGDDDGTADPSSSTEPPPAVTDPSGDATTEPPSTVGTTSTVAGAATEGVEIVDRGFSTYEAVDGLAGSYGVVLENVGGEPIRDFAVEVVVHDTTDAVASSDRFVVGGLQPGARLGLGAEVADSLPHRIGRLDVRVEAGTSGPLPEGAFTVSNVSTSSDEFGMYTRFLVSSSYQAEFAAPLACAVYRDAGGRIVGGASGLVDRIPPRGRANGEVSSFTVVPNAARAEVYVDPRSF
jgi:hypothetical protein